MVFSPLQPTAYITILADDHHISKREREELGKSKAKFSLILRNSLIPNIKNFRPLAFLGSSAVKPSLPSGPPVLSATP
jgi:hypothetical protein